jgi:hypothetical protein
MSRLRKAGSGLEAVHEQPTSATDKLALRDFLTASRGFTGPILPTRQPHAESRAPSARPTDFVTVDPSAP